MTSAESLESRLADFSESVPAYYLNAIRDLLAHRSLEGLRVLEVGGSSLPRALVSDTLGVGQWVCVDLLGHDSGRYQQSKLGRHYAEVTVAPLTASSSIPDARYCIFDGAIEAIPAAFLGRFDVVFSVNAFEHILRLDQALDRCHDALVDGGTLFAQFGPIWSGPAGSHFWVRQGLNFNEPASLRPWGHLLETRQEIAAGFRAAGIDEKSVNVATSQIFDSKFINRLHFEDYKAALDRSSFVAHSLERLWTRAVPEDVQHALEARHPGYSEFGAYGARIVATKHEETDRERRARVRSFLITGTGRSGTSCLTGMFASANVFVGEKLFAPNEANPKGFFENNEINDLNEEILATTLLAGLGSDAARSILGHFSPGQLWLTGCASELPTRWTGTQVERIRRLTAHRPFAFKDPRFAFTAEAWLSVVPGLTVLVTFRDPATTVSSILAECRRAPYLRDLPYSVGSAFELWFSTYWRLISMCASGQRLIFVEYGDLLDAGKMENLAAELGVRIRADFADDALNRSQAIACRSEGCDAMFLTLQKLAAARSEERQAIAVDYVESNQGVRVEGTIAHPSIHVRHWFETR